MYGWLITEVSEGNIKSTFSIEYWQPAIYHRVNYVYNIINKKKKTSETIVYKWTHASFTLMIKNT